MNSAHISSRRTSLDTQSRSRRQSYLDPSTAFLELSRTQSRDLSIAESVAVQDDPQDEVKPFRDGEDATPSEQSYPNSVRYLILLCAFITSTSFGVTQVPLLYVFRLMTCDAYYKTPVDHQTDPSVPINSAGFLGWSLSHIFAPLHKPAGIYGASEYDRCSVPAIESSTALNIALLGATTTIFGIMNLFITGHLVKRIGLKRALVINVATPAVRVFIQNIGVEVWGNIGIIIVQSSQIITVLGGPSGYLLVLNSFMTEVVPYENRTAELGRVAGSMMFGSAVGFLLGGIVAEDLGIQAPFRLSFMLFLAAAFYVAFFLPYIPPVGLDADKNNSSLKEKQSRVRAFFAPLLVFAPKKFMRSDGVIQTEYGTFLLASGVFLAVLATGYIPTLLQLYSTNVFKFGTKANGFLIFMYSLLRGVFLTFAFPYLIMIGRRITTRRESNARGITAQDEASASERDPLLSMQSNANGIDGSKTRQKEQTFSFDLTYTRYSLLADGVLTLLCTFTHQGWQMYLVAAILPFSAGTGSAAKGTVLQMVGSSASGAERTDALAGLSLVENMARLSTTFVFGMVFAAFAGIGRMELVFTVNAAVAAFGFLVLFLARFPPEGSIRLDQVEAISDEEPQT